MGEKSQPKQWHREMAQRGGAEGVIPEMGRRWVQGIQAGWIATQSQNGDWRGWDESRGSGRFWTDKW